MANIVINNYCNLQCPYCFADSINGVPENMSLNEFKDILTFINHAESINILGGEPTLHPQLQSILNILYEYGVESQEVTWLFTNGINLRGFLPWFSKHNDFMRILINCNTPVIQTEEQWSNLLETIDIIYTDETLIPIVILGCNLYSDCADYSYLWNLVDQYNLNTIRVSVSSPGSKLKTWRNKKWEYFNLMKPIFMQFITDATERSVNLMFDCSQLPKCMFTHEELTFIESRGWLQTIEYCVPPVDILMNGKAIPCLGNYVPIDYTNFGSYAELRHYFTLVTNQNAANNNGQGACANCIKREYLTCQGGCLAFAHLE